MEPMVWTAAAKDRRVEITVTHSSVVGSRTACAL
jgi:hypothetical protein